MEIKWTDEARGEFLQLPKNVRSEIKLYTEKLLEKGLEWEKSKSS